MGQMMLHMMHFGPERLALKSSLDVFFKGGGAFHVREALEDQAQARAAAQDVEGAAEVIDLRVPIDRDVIDIAQFEPGIREAPFHGFRGQTGPVFDAAEALFFSGSDEFAIFNEGGGGIAVKGVETEDNHE
jgi:hypothetical protein